MTIARRIGYPSTDASTPDPLHIGPLDLSPLELSVDLTLLLLLLYSSPIWYVRIPITILVILAFLHRSLRLAATFWFVVTAIVLAGNLMAWYSVDNHKHLMAYWCLAIALSLIADKPNEILVSNARMLIGLTFLFAFFWKIVSPDFRSGSFFEYSLLFDDRFRFFAGTFGGQIEPVTKVNRAALTALTSYDSQLHSVRIIQSGGILVLGTVITYLSLTLEGLVAVTFLVPAFGRVRVFGRVRDACLLAFVVSTYSIATVVGFGWTLIIMGIAQCPTRWRTTRVLYLVSFVMLQVYRLPWRELLKWK
jgi:hypothetical protein